MRSNPTEDFRRSLKALCRERGGNFSTIIDNLIDNALDGSPLRRALLVLADINDTEVFDSLTRGDIRRIFEAVLAGTSPAEALQQEGTTANRVRSGGRKPPRTEATREDRERAAYQQQTLSLNESFGHLQEKWRSFKGLLVGRFTLTDIFGMDGGIELTGNDGNPERYLLQLTSDQLEELFQTGRNNLARLLVLASESQKIASQNVLDAILAKVNAHKELQVSFLEQISSLTKKQKAHRGRNDHLRPNR